LNERCTWLVFDNHDIWHFLAGPAYVIIILFPATVLYRPPNRDQEDQIDDQKNGPEASSLM
jgi:hypothetical protein